MSTSKILFQLSGSIACFKACSVISSLVKAGHEVEIAATASALKFVGEATLEGLTGRRVHRELFASGDYMNHIHLVRWADVIVLAPASASTLGRFASGIADDLVSTIFLAHDFTKPYIVVPAMNQAMYAHPATQASLAKLSSWGIQVLGTGTGALACGEQGEGRMLEPDEILAAIAAALAPTVERAAAPGACESRRKILITAGGTVEPIDGVRAITNTSTGRTGAELADALSAQGHDVTLVHARNAAQPARSLARRTFTTFASLDQVLREVLAAESFDAVIHLAAVADYSLAEVESNGVAQKAPLKGKLDSGEELILKLKRNPKIVDSLKAYSRNPKIKVIAFKLTNTEDAQERANAVEQLAQHAQADAIVHNDLHEISGGAHPFTIYPSGARAIGAHDLAEKLGAQL